MEEQKNETSFETWAIVELFGHGRVAGLVSERQIAGAGFIQVDVHDVKGAEVLFTRLINPKSVYAINPVQKEIALIAGETSARPITKYELGDKLLGPSSMDDWD